jgi:hypothetical protein
MDATICRSVVIKNSKIGANWQRGGVAEFAAARLILSCPRATGASSRTSL